MLLVRNEENSFPIHTLIWRPDKRKRLQWYLYLGIKDVIPGVGIVEHYNIDDIAVDIQQLS